MVIDILGWLLFIAACWLTIKVFGLLMELRLAANKVLAASSKEFFASADSLLESADELPDQVLDLLGTMNRYANHAVSQRALLKAVKQIEKHRVSSDDRPDVAEELDNILSGMRPELSALFLKTVVAWLLYISNQSVLVQLRMFLVVLRARSRSIQSPEERVGISLLGILPSVRA